MKKILSVILIMTVLVTSFLPVYAEEPEETFESFYLKTIVEVMAKNYKFGITKGEIYEAVADYVLGKHPELLEGMLEAAADTMDENTYYMPAEHLDSFYEQIDHRYVGIGVVVERVKDAVKVSEVMQNSPAMQAGLHSEDLIICVNGEDVTGLDVSSLSDLIRGEAGTNVELTVRRGLEEINFVITRMPVTTATVAYEIDDENKIGIVSIASFGETTPDELSEALLAFSYSDIKDIIIDLRDNSGGSAQSAIKILSMFVPGGKLLFKTIDAQGREYTKHSTAPFASKKYDLVVLVNENSASASELFAGAIRDNKVGTIIGTKTFGKGTVQTLLGLKDLPDKKLGDIKLTTEEYFLPLGDKVHGIGIKPDIVVKNEEVLLNDGSFAEIVFDAKYDINSRGEGVYAIEQRLFELGFLSTQPDDIYDEDTYNAVYNFQYAVGLYPYGVADITTQNYINNIFNESTKTIDRQFEAGVRFLTQAK